MVLQFPDRRSTLAQLWARDTVEVYLRLGVLHVALAGRMGVSETTLRRWRRTPWMFTPYAIAALEDYRASFVRLLAEWESMERGAAQS